MNVIVTKSSELTSCGNRALVGYLKAKLKMKNNKNFDVKSINLYTFAASLGLPKIPRNRFLEKFIDFNENNSTAIADNESMLNSDSELDSEEDAAEAAVVTNEHKLLDNKSRNYRQTVWHAQFNDSILENLS